MLKSGNYDTYVEHFHFEPAVAPATVQAEKTTYKHAMKTKVHPVIQSKGGLKSTKVVSETVSPDKKTATVVLNHEFNNGETEQGTYELVKANDRWHMRNGHFRDVWHTKTSDGQRLTVKMKEDEYKDVLKEHVDGEAREFVKEHDGERRDFEKVKTEDGREVEKVIHQRDGDVIIKEKADGERNVTKIKA